MTAFVARRGERNPLGHRVAGYIHPWYPEGKDLDLVR
jgi:hypothetical protein